ncbi:MAG: hypothetical protein IT557_19105 [Alphaproteobacteria bacterium]|nr:hypothetical protein [Alphaproteobacteria bacterium]
MTLRTARTGRLAALLLGTMALGLSACATIDDITPHTAAHPAPDGTVTPERLAALAAERETGMYGITTASVSGGGAGVSAPQPAASEAAPAASPARPAARPGSARRARTTSGNTGPSPALPGETRQLSRDPMRAPPPPQRTPGSITPPPLRPQTEFSPTPAGRPSLADLARRTPSEAAEAEPRAPRTATTADGETVVIGPGSRRVMGYLGPSGPGTIHRDGASGTAFGADGTIRPVQFPR